LFEPLVLTFFFEGIMNKFGNHVCTYTVLCNGFVCLLFLHVNTSFRKYEINSFNKIQLLSKIA